MKQATDQRNLARLSELLREKGLHRDESACYRLSSGRTSHYYVDCKSALSYPEFRLLLGQVVSKLFDFNKLDAVGGPEIGAYPIAAAISDEVYRTTGRTLRIFVVRKAAKEHGLQKAIEGDVRAGDKALIVDDVLTSGTSVLQAINGAREAGLEVTAAFVVVDRQEGQGREKIEAAHAPLVALFTLSELVGKPDSSGRARPVSSA